MQTASSREREVDRLLLAKIVQHPRFLLLSCCSPFCSVLLLSAWSDLAHSCVQPVEAKKEGKWLLFKGVTWKFYTQILCSELGHMALGEPKKCSLLFPVKALCVVLLGESRYQGVLILKREREMATCRDNQSVLQLAIFRTFTQDR